MEPHPQDPELRDMVTAKLRDRLPERSVSEIEETVSELIQQYSDSKIRTFIPLFVEREARDRLLARTA